MNEKDERIVDVGEKEPNSDQKIKDNPSVNNNDAQTEAENQNIDIKNKFEYLIPKDENSISFGINLKENNESINALQNENEYKYLICILLKDNSFDNCELLESTFQAIMKNISQLNTFGIDNKDIYIFIFLREIVSEINLIEKDSFKLITKEKPFLKIPLKLNDENEEIKIDLIYKKNMTEIESLKCFYSYFVNNLRKNDKIPIITTVITSGVIPKDDCLKSMIEISFLPNAKKNESKFGIVVPALEIGDNNKNNDFFLKIAQYDRIHFNIYTLNFYCETAAVPISSLLNMIIVDKQKMQDLNSYYKSVSIYSTIDYNDYNLALFLYRHSHTINYYNKEILGTIFYNNFNLMEYRDNWVNKFSGYYGNIFNIVKTFIFCGSNCFPKIFMLFQIFGLFIEFIYPSLSILVIYSIFIEAFNDKYCSIFMTLLYLVACLGSGACSMITNKSKDLESTNYFFYIFMEVYYLFIIVTSIPAMDNIKKKKGNALDEKGEVYIFNIAALVCLLIFTFLLSILPMILKIGEITNNIAQMFMYLLLGAPSSTSNFLIAKIWRAPETMGGNYSEERKGLTVISFLLFNLFFGFISFYMFNRKSRATCVMALAISYLIYLFFKILAILLTLSCGNTFEKKYDKKIKKALSGIENSSLNVNGNDLAKSTDDLKDKNENDIQNEEKLDASNEIKKSQNETNDENDNDNNGEGFKIENNDGNNEGNNENEGDKGNDSGEM